MSKITTKQLEALSASHHGVRLLDGHSLTGLVRVSGHGSKATVSVYFKWRFRFQGKSFDKHLGTWPKETLKVIRAARAKYAAEVRSGINPIERESLEKVQASARQLEEMQAQLDQLASVSQLQNRMTVRELFDDWKRLALRHRKDKGADTLRAFERDVFPAIGHIAVDDIRKAHIQQIVDSMMERDIVRMTKRVLSDMRQMFTFAIDRDIIATDPTGRIRKAKIGPDGERDRVLSGQEIQLLFARLPSSGLTPTAIHALLLQLATLARIGEIIAARWQHVDFSTRIWTLPSTKNGKRHHIWLSDFALQQMQKLHELNASTGWVIPNANRSGHLDPKAISKQVADRQREGKAITGRTQHKDTLMLPGGQWRPHDLRRTGASKMAELGVPPDVIERCLNHTEQNQMKRIYQRPAFEGPMRAAWQRWSASIFDYLGRIADKPQDASAPMKFQYLPEGNTFRMPPMASPITVRFALPKVKPIF